MEGSSQVSEVHPYMPRELHLPGYVPGSLSMFTVLSVYSFFSLIVVSLVWIFSGRIGKIRKVDRVLMCWWAYTGLTHIILEGYYAFSPDFYKDNTGFYLAELWKEYSKGDSRYASRDAGVVTTEAIAAVIFGPACLLALYAIANRKPYSYILQFAVSIGQLYGATIYYIIGVMEGANFSATSFYYYSYVVGPNTTWIVIPLIIATYCWNNICEAVQATTTKKNKLY